MLLSTSQSPATSCPATVSVSDEPYHINMDPFHVVLATVYKILCGTALDGIRIKALKILALEHSTTQVPFMVHQGTAGPWLHIPRSTPLPSNNQTTTIILTTILILIDNDTVFIRLQHRTTVTLPP